MGYDFIIGEKIIIKEDDWDQVWAKDEKHDQAPAYGEPTDYTNERWPSYSNWYTICKDTGVLDLFYKGDTFRGGHPGHFNIDNDFIVEFNKRYRVFKDKYPNVAASYPKEDINGDEFAAGPALVRLEWVHYWVNWAFINCDHPIFANM